MKSVISIVCVLLLLVVPLTFSEDLTADKILKKAEAAYKALEYYRGEGNSITSLDMGATQIRTDTAFTVALKRPNSYRITWSQKMDNMPIVQAGTVWSDGKQPQIYMSTLNAYCPMENDLLALSAATGVSGGAANTIPTLFLAPDSGGRSQFSMMTAPVLTGSEKIGDDDCYVISSPSLISKSETVWISKTSFLMRQCRRSLEPPEGGRTMPDMNDEDLEEGIRAAGQEVTEESKKTFKEMLTSMALMNFKGSMTETHTVISSGELQADDLAYAPPEDAAKKESFGDMMSAAMAMAGSKCPINKDGAAMSATPIAPFVNQPLNKDGAATSAAPSPKSTLEAPAIPPALAEARAKAMIASCANNLKQCGLILKMFANEAPNQWFPPLDPRSGPPMWLKEAIYPEYLTDPVILLCPAEEEKNRAADELKEFDAKAAFSFHNSSYWYLGFAVPNEKTGLAFVEAYRKQAETGGDFTADLHDVEGNPIRRLQEGVERFLVTDIKDPAATAKVQARLPVFIERPGQHGDQINILFMDGHVETRAYPGEFPASQAFIEALIALDALRKT